MKRETERMTWKSMISFKRWVGSLRCVLRREDGRAETFAMGLGLGREKQYPNTSMESVVEHQTSDDLIFLLED
jgi:hypothetical protein